MTDSPSTELAPTVCGNMDAHLIGIEVTQLLLKLKAPGKKKRPVKVEKAAAKQAISLRQTCISPER